MCLALSTSWNAFRYRRAEPLIQEIKGIGFEKVELSFNLSPAMVAQVKRLVRSKEVEVTSVHNFCPIPLGISRKKALPDYYSLASNDKRQRQLAVDFTKRSIDTATQVDAKVVVLHCGRVEVADRTPELIRLYKRGGKGSSNYKRLLEVIKSERKLKEAVFFKNALKSLEALNRYAARQGILLGIETRFYYREIPSFEELVFILKEFSDSQIFYWHDSGHSRVRELLGFEKKNQYLAAFYNRLVGMHLHDVRCCQDHLAPLSGEIDFKGYLPFLNKLRVIKVIEAHYPATVEELKRAKAFFSSWSS